MKDTFGGIGGRLYVFGTGKFGEVMNTYDPDLRLFEAILEKKVIYVALPTMGNNEGAINMGKMFIGDLRTAIAWVQDLPEAKRPDPSFLVLMDEMGSTWLPGAHIIKLYRKGEIYESVLCYFP